jgi:hypothetical protein
LAERFPLQIIKYGQGIRRWQEDLRPVPPHYYQKDVEYHYGPPGIGKSTRAVKDHPDAFIKDCDTKWWDNYQGQKVIILDDFPGTITCVIAKKWLGEVSQQLETKGGTTEMRFEKIFITSNVPPEDCFEAAKQVHRDAFCRRLLRVYKYSWSSAPLSEESRAKGYTSERSVQCVKDIPLTVI